MIFISEPQRHSGNAVEPAMSRRSNFDILYPPHRLIVRDRYRHCQLREGSAKSFASLTMPTQQSFAFHRAGATWVRGVGQGVAPRRIARQHFGVDSRTSPPNCSMNARAVAKSEK